MVGDEGRHAQVVDAQGHGDVVELHGEHRHDDRLGARVEAPRLVEAVAEGFVREPEVVAVGRHADEADQEWHVVGHDRGLGLERAGGVRTEELRARAVHRGEEQQLVLEPTRRGGVGGGEAGASFVCSGATASPRTFCFDARVLNVGRLKRTGGGGGSPSRTCPGRRPDPGHFCNRSTRSTSTSSRETAWIWSSGRVSCGEPPAISTGSTLVRRRPPLMASSPAAGAVGRAVAALSPSEKNKAWRCRG